MLSKRQITIAAVLLCALTGSAAQSTPYVITESPVAAMGQTMDIWVKWTGQAELNQPDTIPGRGKIYYATSPGGGVISNYTDSITAFRFTLEENYDGSYDTTYFNNQWIPGPPPRRGIKFRPVDQPNMGPGVYYYIVGWRETNPNTEDTIELYSNELMMIIESDQATILSEPGPGEAVTTLTPTFTWRKNPGVPYYHILVSDEKISPNLDDQSIEGLSLVWQAITADNQITYGSPDPSGEITANPPPLSPGQEYSWIVLNNYGNHPAYTSKNVGLPQSFSIAGEGMDAPENVYPENRDVLEAASNPTIEFTWSNLDTNANTFKIYAYVASDFEGMQAQLLVWEDEVTAGQFADDSLGRVTVDAANIFTSNYYTWKVIAVDEKGAGSAGEVTGFRYTGIPSGVLKVYTRENINAGDTTIVQKVSGVKIKLEVLDGSMEAPLLYYTDPNGALVRTRPAGQFRLTAIKNGFESATKTVTIGEGDTSIVFFYLERPDATVFGRVLDEGARGVNLAEVVGVSDRGDTMTAQTDALGNFVLNCYEADWDIWVRKTGFVSSVPRDTSVTFGQSVNFGVITLGMNPYTLSGVVKNTTGNPVLGAKVELLLEGTKIAEVPSTAENGGFSFALESGTYTLKVTKTGFSSSAKQIDVLSSKQINVTLSPGAALIRGAILGETWGNDGRVYAPITNCAVMLIDQDTSVTPPETLVTYSDATYGDFEVSIVGGKRYTMYSSADGFIGAWLGEVLEVAAGVTDVVKDTLTGLATLAGTVTTSSADSAVGGVAVVLIDTATGMVAATVKSDALGTFEIRGITDGVYRVQSGKVGDDIGFVQDTVLFSDTSGASTVDSLIEVVYGQAVRTTSTPDRILASLDIKVRIGDKSIFWTVEHRGIPIDANVKVRSPIVKSVTRGDTLKGVGSGTYVITVDADDPSIIDKAEHVTNVPDNGSDLTSETITLYVAHSHKETLSVADDGTVTCSLYIYDSFLDSVWMYYKDISAQAYDSMRVPDAVVVGSSRQRTISIEPPKNGSNLKYYFRGYKDADRFGYEQETFVSYIRPDASKLTKIEVFPSTGDTLILPADAEVDFTFAGYYGSKFISDTTISDEDVSWYLLNAGGSGLNNRTRTAVEDKLVVTVNTPKGGQTAPATLVAVVDTTVKFADGVSDSVKIVFTVSSGALDSIRVKRVDGDGAITTASADRAVFVADGLDSSGTILTISPIWSVSPPEAGEITTTGTFDPAPNFAGYVRVMAGVANVSGEFNSRTGKLVNESGLEVHYIIPVTRDTLVNGRGLSVIFPANLVMGGAEGEVAVGVPFLKNKVASNTGDFTVIGDAYDIDEENGVVFDTTDTKKILLRMDMPQDFVDEAVAGTGVFVAGLWNEDSLTWDSLPGTEIAEDGTYLTVAVTHFSRYGILYKKGDFKGEFSIKPNPFSPFIRPVPEVQNDNLMAGVYGSTIPLGTCIRFTPKAKSLQLTAHLDIHTITGQKVLSVQRQVDPNKTYFIWWDGKTDSDGSVKLQQLFAGNTYHFMTVGNKMCRNGRYFAVLTLIDQNGDKKRYMKPVVLFK